MSFTHIGIGLAVHALAVAAAAAQPEPSDRLSPMDRAEFNKLVHQRDRLYTELALLNEPGPKQTGSPQAIQSETRWVQSQLDLVERRLAVVGTQHGVPIPRKPRTATDSDARGSSAVAMAADPGTAQHSPRQRAVFNKLVYRRNKLHAQLEKLDEQASEHMKMGENPLMVHAEQISVLDQLDLVELQLAILSTRYGLAVPPLPGRDPATPGGTARPGDEMSQDLEQAFVRGRNRAIRRLSQDAEEFLASLDFWAFLND